MEGSSGGRPGRPAAGYQGSGPHGTLTEAEARVLLEELARSGKTLAAFAHDKGMSGSRLGWWKKKFSKHRAGSGAQAPAAFVPVRVKPALAPVGAAPFEVVLRCGHTLRVPAGFDAAALRRLLAALEGGAC